MELEINDALYMLGELYYEHRQLQRIAAVQAEKLAALEAQEEEPETEIILPTNRSPGVKKLIIPDGKTETVIHE
jgi:hypothetical protein